MPSERVVQLCADWEVPGLAIYRVADANVAAKAATPMNARLTCSDRFIWPPRAADNTMVVARRTGGASGH